MNGVRHLSRAWLGALLASLVACEEAPPPAPDVGDATATATVRPSTTAQAPPPPSPGYPAGSWQPIRDDAQRHDLAGMVVFARSFVAKMTPNDPIALAIRFEAVDAKQSLDWSASLGKTKFVITAGAQREELELSAAPTASDVSELSQRARVLSLEPTGLRQFAVTTPFKTPSKLLGQVGELTIQLRGELMIDGTSQPFETAPLKVSVEAAGAELQPLASLEGIASRLVSQVEKEPSPAMLGQPVEDEAHNRVFRFRATSPSRDYTMRVVDVALSPRGGVVGAHAFDHFTCVARGTRIATPSGERAIEDLAVGDVVWGFDTRRKQRVRTPIRSVTEDFTSELIVIDGLRITAHHPVFVGGGWRDSHQLTPGATLLGFDLVERPIASMDVIATHESVFDLDVAWPHNFFAASVLVHNKAAHVPLGRPDDPWQGLFSRDAPTRR